MSNVGIFWFVPSNVPLTSTMIYDLTPIAEASGYAGLKTHDRGHYEYWSSLASLGSNKLRGRGEPTIIARSEYEAYPRGRVVYDPSRQHFIIYADRRLHGQEFIDVILLWFDIPAGRFSVKGDQHYANTLPVRLPRDVY
ncbi:hypothetical protein D3Y57_14320 [Sphingomonas paeninsulae]|uniref:Uncharacterized protein n=1 Tax=Sphingomonas paeninsulae TaxID=2319844 RepID=A0A494TBS0_SPHPE|nr:hypothetical protein [Sphingomonas paeninsulae]AYJ86899.1 hypothetical protein D3Y57_14320 [Sphingomonas paeninsulae]